MLVSQPLDQLLPVDDNWVKGEKISNCVEEYPEDGCCQVSQGHDKESEVNKNLVCRIDNLKGHRRGQFIGPALDRY